MNLRSQSWIYKVHPYFTVHALLLFSIVTFCIVYPIITGLNGNELFFSFSASPKHWLGQDLLHRDLGTRLAVGGRLSLSIALLSATIATCLGTLIGVLSGTFSTSTSPWVDKLILRIIEILLSIPSIIIISVCAMAVHHVSILSFSLIFGLCSWIGTAHIVRSKTIELNRNDYIFIAQSLGSNALVRTWRHTAPFLAPLLKQLFSISIARMILAEAALSYLGLGLQPPTPSWGRMIHESEPYLMSDTRLFLLPMFMITITTLSLHQIFDPPPITTIRTVWSRLPFELLLFLTLFTMIAIPRSPTLIPPANAIFHSSPMHGGTLRIATMLSVRSLDPASNVDESNHPIVSAIFGQLVTIDHTGKIHPSLVESFTEKERSLRIHLREDVVFHDGQPMHAEDIKRSFERAFHPKNANPLAPYFSNIVGFDAYHAGMYPEISGIRVDEEFDVTFLLTQPDTTLLPLLTLPIASPVCRSMALQSNLSLPPCGAGPFRFEQWSEENTLVLLKHDHYFDRTRPYVNRIEWQSRMRPTTQRYRLEQGSIDIATDVSSTDIALFRSNPSWEKLIREVSRDTINGIFLNTEVVPLNNKMLRRAIAWAIDPSPLTTLRPSLQPITHVLPTTYLQNRNPLVIREHHLQRALECMKQAGFPYDATTQTGGYPEEIEFVTVSDSLQQYEAELYQQQLLSIGIHIRLRLLPFSQYLEETSHRKTVPMGWAGWGADFPDPLSFYEPLFSTKAISEYGSTNRSFFSNNRFDTLLAEVRTSIHPRKRWDIFNQMDQILHDEMPWIPTYTVKRFEAHQSNVYSTFTDELLSDHVDNVWITSPGDSSLPSLRNP